MLCGQVAECYANTGRIPCERWAVLIGIGSHYIVNNDYIWMNGNDLTKILNDNWIPWIFAVFSAFNPCISLDDILKHELPFADGNGEFWKDNVTLQHPLADIEIVPWDGNHLLIISKDDSVVDQFMSSYSTAYDLQADNRKTNAQVKRIEDIVLASGNGQLIPQVCNTNLKWKIWHDIYKNATSEPNEKEILQSAIRLVNSN